MALPFATPAPASPPAFAPGALHGAFAATLAPCAGDAACSAEAASAFAAALSARSAALPTGRAGVAAQVEAVLAEAGYPVPAARATVQSPTLTAAILGLYGAIGHPVDAALEAEVARQADAVAPDLAAALVPLVDAVTEAHLASRAILPPADVALLASDPALALRLTTLVGSAPAGTADPRAAALWEERAAALARVDRAAIAAAALPLARAVSAFSASAAADCARVLSLPFVEVGGACDDTYTAFNALQVDFGGSDTYLNNAGAGLVGAVGAGASLDLGDCADTYFAEAQAQGFGLAAVGILYDEGGADSYTLTQFGQGFAVGGLGLLYDAGAGDDVYETPRSLTGIGTKAGALAGVGILVDEGGNDLYHADGLDAFVYGAAGGHGWLVEMGGNDRYVSNDLPITLLEEYLGEFTGPIQVSSEVAGTAVLLERGGNDLYRCGDHVRQGCQGAAGAASFTLLLDEAGDDQYLMGVSFSTLLEVIPIFSMGQGAAYGPSAPGGLAALVDRAGNDRYAAEKWAQGYGTVGFGALVDEAGADAYETAAPELGTRADGGAWVAGALGAGIDRA